MPIYQFTITRGDHKISLDPIELSSREEAWREASDACALILKDSDGHISELRELKVHVTDSSKDLFCVRAVADVFD